MTSAKSPWRAYLDLDFRVTEKRRSNKVLDTLKKEYRRTSTAHRGQHKTQRGVGVFVVVDIEKFLRFAKSFHQSRELTPVAQTVDFESHCVSVREHIESSESFVIQEWWPDSRRVTDVDGEEPRSVRPQRIAISERSDRR